TSFCSAAKKYSALGLSVLPLGADKRPVIERYDENGEPQRYSWKALQSRIASDAAKDRWFTDGTFPAPPQGIGIICGPVANLEGIDVDLKNDSTGEVEANLLPMIANHDADLANALAIVETQNKGLHI